MDGDQVPSRPNEIPQGTEICPHPPSPVLHLPWIVGGQDIPARSITGPQAMTGIAYRRDTGPYFHDIGVPAG